MPDEEGWNVDGLGISRSTVREAIRRLTAEGLIESRYHYGARVRRFTRHTQYTRVRRLPATQRPIQLDTLNPGRAQQP